MAIFGDDFIPETFSFRVNVVFYLKIYFIDVITQVRIVSDDHQESGEYF